MTIRITVEGPTGSGKPLIIAEIKRLLETGLPCVLSAYLKEKETTFEFIEKLPE